MGSLAGERLFHGDFHVEAQIRTTFPAVGGAPPAPAHHFAENILENV